MSDFINMLFGVFASILAYQNIKEAKKHKEIKGMHWSSTAFFTSWGIWNLYFYASLDLYFSLIGSLCIVFVDGYWLYLYFKLRKL